MVKTIISFLLTSFMSASALAYGCSEGWVESGTYLETKKLISYGHWTLKFVAEGPSTQGTLSLVSTGADQIRLSTKIDTAVTPLDQIEQKVSDFKTTIPAVVSRTTYYMDDPGCDLLKVSFKSITKHIVHVRLDNGQSVDFEGLYEYESKTYGDALIIHSGNGSCDGGSDDIK